MKPYTAKQGVIERAISQFTAPVNLSGLKVEYANPGLVDLSLKADYSATPQAVYDKHGKLLCNLVPTEEGWYENDRPVSLGAGETFFVAPGREP